RYIGPKLARLLDRVAVHAEDVRLELPQEPGHLPRDAEKLRLQASLLRGDLAVQIGVPARGEEPEEVLVRLHGAVARRDEPRSDVYLRQVLPALCADVVEERRAGLHQHVYLGV